MSAESADIIVIGAGMAGVSAAAELAADASVIVLEMEAQPGYHATGRSAAFFAAAYGNSVVRGITAASEHFYRSPPADFCTVELLRPRDCVYIASAGQRTALQVMQVENPRLHPISAQQVRQRVPVLAAASVAAALLEEGGGDLDVDAVLQGYLRLLRRRGGVLRSGQQVQSLQRRRGCWRVRSNDCSFTAPVVVNAAGAWADQLAEMAGIGGLGLVPKRRTAILIDAPPGMDVSSWPMVVDAEESFYIKPEAGRLLVSPADASPSVPCDAQPEELDVALTVHRFEQATGVPVKRINHRWAGLRTFAPDHSFVVGFDPRAESFCWLAGQGGYGIQSAPGLARLCANLVVGASLAPGFQAVQVFTGEVAPGRLLHGGDQP